MLATVASVALLVTVDDVLLRNLVQLSSFDSEGCLGRCRCGEGEARAAGSLVLNRAHNTPIAPVNFQILARILGHDSTARSQFGDTVSRFASLDILYGVRALLTLPS